MKKIAILLILITLNDSSFAQSIADALEQNDRRLLPAAVEAVVAFRPGGPTSVQQNSGWREMGTLVLGDISNNYWVGGSYGLCFGTTGTGAYLFSKPWTWGWSCSSGLIAQKKHSVPFSSLQADTTPPSCGDLFGLGYELESDNIEPEAYDTLSMFLEQCPFYGDSVENGPDNSWEAFTFIGGAVSGWTAGGAGRWPDFLALLKKVLYNNPDTNWYCNDVGEMVSAAQSAQATEAICEYMIQSGKCPGFTADFQTELNASKNYLHTRWKDSVVRHWDYIDTPYNPERYIWQMDSINADTLAHPFDTTVPTLFQDSLEILLWPQYAGVQQNAPSPIASQALLSAQLLQNPINNEIDVSYQMGRNALVTMELRDVLGRSVPLSYAKYQLEQPGSHNASISAPNLPEGTYYLRITTDVGDAITLKIVKE